MPLLPEIVQDALDRIESKTDIELNGDDLLSRVVTRIAGSATAADRVHGAALVLVTADAEGNLSIHVSTDVWSKGGLNGLAQGLDVAQGRVDVALAVTPSTTAEG